MCSKVYYGWFYSPEYLVQLHHELYGLKYILSVKQFNAEGKTVLGHQDNYQYFTFMADLEKAVSPAFDFFLRRTLAKEKGRRLKTVCLTENIGFWKSVIM